MPFALKYADLFEVYLRQTLDNYCAACNVSPHLISLPFGRTPAVLLSAFLPEKNKGRN